jgi:hypothetical protein
VEFGEKWLGQEGCVLIFCGVVVVRYWDNGVKCSFALWLKGEEEVGVSVSLFNI